MSTWTGKTLGNVIIGELIARGGMAEVYFGSHTTLNRNVAVKIMRDHVEDDPDSRNRFSREARVVASLKHNNIIQIHDYTLVDGRPCLVMELVAGASLANYLKALQKRGEKLSHSIIAHLLSEIAEAVDYAHEHNIVHRDIKPANILLRSKEGPVDTDLPLSPDAEPVLTDFGLVRLLDSTTQTSTGTVSGTPAYMSPEQARGDRVERQTDIYSLGVVLYEMLAGCVPFDAESSFGVLMKHINEPPPPIAGIPAGMQDIIDRALAKDPSYRFESAREMAIEFTHVLAGGTISQKTETITNQLKTTETSVVNAPRPVPVQNKNWAWVAGLFLTVALVIGAVFWQMRPQKPQASGLINNPDQAVGKVSFQDYGANLDKVIINLGGLPIPEPGTHYEAWLLAQGGETSINIGAVSFAGPNGQVSLTSPEGVNLLGMYDQVNITLEPDNDPFPEVASETVVASSIFPPMAFNHVRHVLVSIGNTPDGLALIQGLWLTAESTQISTRELNDAFAEEDEELVRIKTEEIINQIVGDQNIDLYQDWNTDGEVSDPSDGYGLLLNAEERGYLPQTASHANFAASAPDATPSIDQASNRLRVCTDNMQGWSKQLVTLARELQEMPFGPSMESVISEMVEVADNNLYGIDSNGNGKIDARTGECGALTAYEIAYELADMPLLSGVGRIPPAAQKP